MVALKRKEVLAKSLQVGDVPERDILSRLSESHITFVDSMPLIQTPVKSNMSEDPARRMSDEELMDQISTLLFAGSDTTSLAITWCFHQLSLNSRVQKR